jgi:lincosamide and streptogramin A transport system ATP-binding/permease protein
MQKDAFEAAENERLKRDIKRLETGARRASNWSDDVEKSKTGAADKGYVGHKSAKMMKRAKNLEKHQRSLIDEKSQLLRNVERGGDLKLSFLEYHSRTLVRAESLSLYYGTKPICENVTFTIETGDRVALEGKNGSGKSTLMKRFAETDENVSCSGLLYVGGGLVVSYVPQDASPLSGSLSAFARDARIDESLFKAVLHKLDFSKTQFDKSMSDFSDGQKKKVMIARSMCERAHLYIWDEPLNYVDVFSRIQIENLLRQFSPTIIFVEHDAAFRENIATKQVLL